MRSRRYRILIVEDHDGDIQLMREAFSECGRPCELSFAGTIQEANRVLRTQLVDILITDMTVQDGETVDFIRQVRLDPKLRMLPVIVLSGSADVRPAYEAGANAFIAKPLNYDELVDRVRALVHFWTETAELPPRD